MNNWEILIKTLALYIELINIPLQAMTPEEIQPAILSHTRHYFNFLIEMETT